MSRVSFTPVGRFGTLQVCYPFLVVILEYLYIIVFYYKFLLFLYIIISYAILFLRIYFTSRL